MDNLVYRRRRLIDAAAITAHESGTDSVDLPRAQNTDIKALTTTGGTEIAPQNYLDALTAEGGTENIPQDYLDSLVIDGGTEVVSKTYIDSVTQEGVTEFVPETYIDSVTQEGAVEVVPESFLDTVTAEGATEQGTADYLATVTQEGATVQQPKDYLATVTQSGAIEQRNVPAEYEQLEYIKSDGTDAYIDTGIILNSWDATVTTDFRFLSTSAEATPKTIWGFMGGNTYPRWGLAKYTIAGNTSLLWSLNATYGSCAVDTDRHTAYQYIAGLTGDRRAYLVLDGGSPLDGGQVSIESDYESNTLSAYLFARNYNGVSNFCDVEIYGIKMEQNGAVVFNGIPARRLSDNAVGIYDTVSGTLKTASAGTLTGGNAVTPSPETPMDLHCNNGVLKARHQSGLPLGYTQVEYLRSSGTEYIDTGRKATEKTHIRVKHRYYTSSASGTSGRIFGARYTDGDRAAFVIGTESGYASTTTTNFSQVGNNPTGTTGPSVVIDTWRVLDLDNTGFRIDGVSYGNSYDGNAFETPYNILILGFAQSAHGTSTPTIGCGIGDISSFEWWEDGVKVLDLIPASDGTTAGFYDLINGNFLTNAGTGDFTAGTAISDPVIIYADGDESTITDANGYTASLQPLLAVGDYKDTQEVISGAVTRNVGVKVLDGTEGWLPAATAGRYYLHPTPEYARTNFSALCTHYPVVSTTTGSSGVPYGNFGVYTASGTWMEWYIADTQFTTVAELTARMAADYAAGNPWIVVYPLQTPTTETVTGQVLTEAPLTTSADVTLPAAVTTTSTWTTPDPDHPLDIKCNNGTLKLSPNLVTAPDYWTYSGYGVTITTSGDGIYHFSGTATANLATDTIPLNPFTTPISVNNGGRGLMAFHNSQGLRAYVAYMNGTTVDETWALNPADRVNPSYPSQEGETVNGLRFQVDSGVNVDGLTVAPAIYNDGRTTAGTFIKGGIYSDGTPETITDANNHVATLEPLLAVGNYKDIQEVIAGAVARNVGVKVLDGTENWVGAGAAGGTAEYLVALATSLFASDVDTTATYVNYLCSHLPLSGTDGENRLTIVPGITYGIRLALPLSIVVDAAHKVANAKAYLAAQYAAGTPVIIIYPLATATTETVAGQTLVQTPLATTAEITMPALTTTTSTWTTPDPDHRLPILCNNGELKARHQSGLPLGYTRVEYISSDGNQYIDTLINQTTLVSPRIVTTFRKDESADRDLFGGATGGGGIIWDIAPLNAAMAYIRWKTSAIRAVSLESGHSLTELAFTNGFHTLDVGGVVETDSIPIKVDGTQMGSLVAATVANWQNANIWFFRSQRSGQNGACSYKDFAIYSNGELVFNGIAAKRDSDDELGFYDFVSGDFFTNAGTGTFTAGSEVSDPAEVYTDGTPEVLEVTGKNLFDVNAITANMFLSDLGESYINDNSNISAYIPVDPSTTYTLSLTRTDTLIYCRVCDYSTTDEASFISLLVKDTDTTAGNRVYTFTTSATAQYVRFCYKNDSTGIQLELGSTATTYEPYHYYGTANAEDLFKVGTYADTQEVIAGAVMRNVGVKVLDGTENWTREAAAAGSTYRESWKIADAKELSYRLNIPITHFHYDATANDEGVGFISGGVLYLYGDPNWSNEEWKAWLAAQYAAGTPVIVIYPLATATTESVDRQLAHYTGTNFAVNATGSVTPLTATTVASVHTAPTPDCPLDLLCNNGVITGYRRLEYIESSGTQYIDTGLSLNTAYKYEIVAASVNGNNTSNIWGYKSNSAYTGGKCCIIGWTNTNPSYIGAYNKNGNISGVFPPISALQWTAGTFFDIVMDVTNSHFIVDGTDYYSTSGVSTVLTTDSWTDTHHPYLFGTQTVDAAVPSQALRVKAYRVYDGDTLVQNFVPAANGTTCGMYDLVSGKFFTNAGTGSFTAGPDLGWLTIGDESTITDADGRVVTLESLLGVGTYKDTQEILSGLLTRNVGVKVLDGTEAWAVHSSGAMSTLVMPHAKVSDLTCYCTHFEGRPNSLSIANMPVGTFKQATSTEETLFKTSFTTTTDWQAWLAAQYAAGDPVIVIYPLTTATTENVTKQLLQYAPVTAEAEIPVTVNTVTSVHTTPAPGQPLDIRCNNGIVTADGASWSAVGHPQIIKDADGHYATVASLLKVGTYADSEIITSGAITRHVGVKVLTGTETWDAYSGISGVFYSENAITNNRTINDTNPPSPLDIMSTHYAATDSAQMVYDNTIRFQQTAPGGEPLVSSNRLYIRNTDYATVTAFKAYLAECYAAGDPVIILYPLATSTTETVTAQPLTSKPLVSYTNMTTQPTQTVTESVHTTPNPNQPLDLKCNNGIYAYDWVEV